MNAFGFAAYIISEILIIRKPGEQFRVGSSGKKAASPNVWGNSHRKGCTLFTSNARKKTPHALVNQSPFDFVKSKSLGHWQIQVVCAG